MNRTLFTMGWSLLLTILLCASACERPPTTECFPGKSLPLKKIETTESKYLPRKIVHEVFKKADLEDEKRLDKSLSEVLIALKEPSLLTDSVAQEESYRFLWLRSWHEPISLRVSRIGNDLMLTIKKSPARSPPGTGCTPYTSPDSRGCCAG